MKVRVGKQKWSGIKGVADDGGKLSRATLLTVIIMESFEARRIDKCMSLGFTHGGTSKKL